MADITITFLGTATSQGVPLIGCDCAVCHSSDPRDTRTRSSIHVKSPGCEWVIDTGTDFRAQCLRENITRLDAVVYTHAHTDHIMGFDDLRAFCNPGQPMPVYASEETLGHLKRVFDFAFNGKNRFPGYVNPLPIPIAGPFTLGDITVEALPILHGRTRVNGYLLSRGGKSLAAYLSDCKEVPEHVLERIKGTRFLIIDALRHRPHPTHMSVDEALAFASKVKPEKTWFTHVCHELGHEETKARLPADVRIAYDGMKLLI